MGLKCEKRRYNANEGIETPDGKGGGGLAWKVIQDFFIACYVIVSQM